MAPTPVRGIWLSEDTHAALAEYAWLKRTSMSNVARAVLDEVRESKTIDSVLGVEDIPGRTRLSIKTSATQWEEAMDAAARLNVSLQSLVRRHIIKILKEEGLL